MMAPVPTDDEVRARALARLQFPFIGPLHVH
jgi:hypothetical protein